MDITQLTFKTYDGHDINNGTAYKSLKFPAGQAILPDTTPVYTERVDAPPVDGGVRQDGRDITIRIMIKSAGTMAELESWFDTTIQTTRILVGTDLSAVDWYIYARPKRFMHTPSSIEDYVTITLFAPDPVWKSVTVQSDTKNITATGQTTTLAIGGNKYARPKIVVGPTTARTAGFTYKHYIAVANRTSRIYEDGLNLPDSNWDTSALVSDTTVSNQINVIGGISAIATTWDIDTPIGGGLAADGTFWFGTEQCSYTGKTATNIGTVVRGINGTTAAAHADNAVMTQSRIQADGDDVRVINDETGIEEYRWFGGGGINSSTTRVFSNVYLPPKMEGTLSGSIAGSGAVSTITLKSTAANKTFLRRLKQVGYKFVAIDMGTGNTERFSFIGVNVNALQITGCTRAQKNTSMQTHADGATVRHIKGYYLMYGNSSMTAPTVDDGYKPIFNLASSTNSSHVYADFFDINNPNRLGQWEKIVNKNVGLLSELYTATADTFADVASVIGIAVKMYYNGTTPHAPNVEMGWGLYHPAGITTLTWTGTKYRLSTSWPALTAMQKSNTGADDDWATIANEATPASANTPASLSSHSSVSLSGTYLNIRNIIRGAISAVANNLVYLEIADLTATLDSSNTPLIEFASQEVNNYEEPRITNNTNGQWIEFAQEVPVDQTVTIDVENLEAYTSQGVPVAIRLDDESRAEWMQLGTNSSDVFVGTAELQFDETGTVAATMVTTWNNRNL